VTEDAGARVNTLAPWHLREIDSPRRCHETPEGAEGATDLSTFTQGGTFDVPPRWHLRAAPSKGGGEL
jgi:hypothetical protein